jgi:hypothetical protein
MLCPLFFLIKVGKGKIRTAKPSLSANEKRFDGRNRNFQCFRDYIYQSNLR